MYVNLHGKHEDLENINRQKGLYSDHMANIKTNSMLVCSIGYIGKDYWLIYVKKIINKLITDIPMMD